MIDIGFVDVLDAVIVDDQGERDLTGFVTEETFGVFGFDIIVLGEMFDEVVMSNESTLFYAVLSGVDLCVDRRIHPRHIVRGCSMQ